MQEYVLLLNKKNFFRGIRVKNTKIDRYKKNKYKVIDNLGVSNAAISDGPIGI